MEKAAVLPKEIRWHIIGKLQSREWTDFFSLVLLETGRWIGAWWRWFVVTGGRLGNHIIRVRSTELTIVLQWASSLYL